MKAFPFLCLVATGLMVGMAARADAQTLEATYLGPGPSMAIRGVVDGDLVIDAPAGVQEFDVFSGFSVDPARSLVNGESLVYTIQDPATLEFIGVIRRIVGAYYVSAQSPVDAAGAQWAIWEVLGDGPDNPSFIDGTVRLFDPDSEVARRALDYLGILAELPSPELLYLTQPIRQDMVSAVPEPGAAALAACAAALAALRRRRTAA